MNAPPSFSVIPGARCDESWVVARPKWCAVESAYRLHAEGCR